MDDELELFSTKEAADYLGVAVTTLKKHLYVTKLLAPPKKVGQALVFTRAQLDEFQARRRPVGRSAWSRASSN